MPDTARRGSLGRRITLIVAVNAVVVVAMAVGVLLVEGRMRHALTQATRDYVEEARIGDAVNGAVVRQIVAATSYDERPTPEMKAAFERASNAADVAIRGYLFRDLSLDERLQLERIKELHQALEVTGANAIELYAKQGASAARSSEMAREAFALQAALEKFLAMRQQRLEALRDRQARAFGVLTAAVVAVAVVLLVGMLVSARFLRRRIARPLGAFADAAARLGAGDLSTRVSTRTRDEFAALAGSFNRMADGLADARRALERRNQELEQALDELRSTQNELVQTEKMGVIGRMMAGLAHELNNPLASVLGFAELLDEQLEADAGAEAGAARLRRDYVEPLLSEAARARELVRGLLAFSRRSATETEAVPLRPTLTLVTRLRQYAFQQAGLSLRLGEVPDVGVLAESQRLQQIFLNIVNNALDAMREAGTGALEISATACDDRVDVFFDDEGPGIRSPEHVFEPFYTTKPPGEGTGLGLALVHRFMEEFGGSIKAENRPAGGARFRLSFRRTELPEQPAAPPPETTAEFGTYGDGRAPRVLVVDDEPRLLALQRRMLARLQADVTTAETAEQARALMGTHEFDLVITDVRMPGGSGIELYDWIRERRPSLTESVLFVTGDPGGEDVTALAERVAGRVLHKPFRLADYLSIVRRALEAG